MQIISHDLFGRHVWSTSEQKDDIFGSLIDYV